MKGKRTLFTLLALYALLAITYSVVNPLFESPDEVWHYEYVRWLVEGHGLPEPEDVGHAPWHQEGSQPPLYYLAAAAITAPIATDNADQVIRYNPHAAIGQAENYGNKNVVAHDGAQAWPWRGVTLAAHLARFFSILLGTATVLFTYLTAETLFPWRRSLPVLAAALVAFNPQFLFISAAVNNDNLVTAVCAAGVWLLATLLPRHDSSSPYDAHQKPSEPSLGQLLLLGVLVGLAALSKLSGLLLAGYVGLVLAYVALRRRSLRDLLTWGLVIGGVALLLSGWWFLRNALLFGDPLLLSAMFAILPKRAEPPTLNEVLARLEGVWRSFWAVWGWFNVVADPWLYRFYNWLTLLGLAGLAAGPVLQRLYRRRADRADGHEDPGGDVRDAWQGILFLAIWVALIALLLLYWAQMRYPQGRLLFPAISALAVLLAYGLTSWLPTRAQPALVWTMSALLLAIAIIVPWRWIGPAYAAPGPMAAEVTPELTLPNPLEATFGERLQLSGFQLHDVEVEPGEPLHLDLYWQALAPLDKDYSIFVHLTDVDQLLQAQRDSFPGAGNAPTLHWPTGVIVPDRHEIVIPPTAPSPARLRVDVGVYDHTSGERLLVGGYDHWTLGYVTLLPPGDDSGLPHAMSVNFDDQIALRGFDFDRRTLNPGDTVAITLWWEALTKLETNYTVFVHIVLPPDATWAQRDDTPQDGATPTSTWEVGQLIEDRWEVKLPEDAPPGVYFVEVGIYERATNDRLKVNFSEKGTVLGQLRVEEAGQE